MTSTFWEGFEKRAGLLSMAAKPFLSAASNIGRMFAKKPLATGGAALGVAEGASVALDASKKVVKSKGINRASSLYSPNRSF